MTPKRWELARVEAEAVRNKQRALDTLERCRGEEHEKDTSIPGVILTLSIVLFAIVAGYIAGSAFAML